MNKENFENPTALFRPAPFWSFNDDLIDAELVRQIDEMKEKGWGSYFMHSRVGLVTPYLTDEWMDKIKLCCVKAKKTKTKAWLYDEDKWPSGYAGGEVPLINDEYRSRALVFIKKNEMTDMDTLIKEVEYNNDNYSICTRVDSLGSKIFNGTSYVDLMNPNAVKAFLDSTHEKYKEHLNEYFGQEIPGIFTDEPCYLLENHYSVPCVPWSKYLRKYILQNKGYDIKDHIDKLFLPIDDYKKIRYEYYECATLLFKESFTKQYYDWCEENGLIMTGHFMAEDDMVFQTQWIGSAMPHYEFMHWPGIDKLGRHLEQFVTVKQLSSVTDQLNKERAFCEVFGCIGQQSSFFHRKWIGDWQAALGINFVNHHLALYSMRGERKRDYPANLFYQQPWWDNEKDFSDYMGRVSYSLTQGKREVKILVIHTIGSVWSEYSPLNADNNFMLENNLYNNPFDELSKALAYSNLDFHYGDELLMEKYAKVENGKIKVGDYIYDTVILPPYSILRNSTKKFLEDIGPENIVSYKNGVNSYSKTSFEDLHEIISYLDIKHNKRIRAIDKSTDSVSNKILSHVRSDNKDTYVFLSNTEETREIETTIILPDSKNIYALDLNSAKTYKLNTTKEDAQNLLDVTFYPAGSILLLLTSKSLPALESPNFLMSGVRFPNNYVHLDNITNFKITLKDKNILPLDKVTFILDDMKILENEHISKGWHEHFYSAKDGTNFEVIYEFYSDITLSENTFIAIEMAENLDEILLNGNLLKPLKRKGEKIAFDSNKSYLDVNFTKVMTDGHIKKGKNILKLKGKKYNNITGPGNHSKVKNPKNHYPTELETVYIVGDFSLGTYDSQTYYISKKTSPNILDITQTGYPFYSGTIIAECNIDLPINNNKKLYISINDGNFSCAKAFINNEQIGLVYNEPYVYEIPAKLCDNEIKLKLEITNTLYNLMGPLNIDKILIDEGIGPHTFVDFKRMDNKKRLLPFKIGSISIFAEK